ncbi:MAG TPA: hypothetical protein VFY05_09595 [Candidatus Angelobacter sp.]|nr:hypothetical protein [Candidatus Angelobacter sp.]
MKKSGRILIATFAMVAAVLVVSCVLFGWMFYRYQSTSCKERRKAYEIRVDSLKRDARTALRIGTHQEDVIRFFQENGFPVSFDNGMSEYEGTIRTKGCAPAGCGSDDALLGLRVKVDSTGTVVGEPVVGTLYTNCL